MLFSAITLNTNSPLEKSARFKVPIAEYAVSLLKQAGHKASYPGMVVNTDGTVEYEE